MSEIMAFDPERNNNAKLMVDCKLLGYLDGVVADVTYNAGRFWRLVDPPKLRFDLDPQWGVDVADFRTLPLATRTIDTVVLDPRYKLSGVSSGKGPASLDPGYGVEERYQSVQAIHDMIQAGIDEAHRVLRVGGRLLLKCQAQQSSGRMNDQPGMFAEQAVASGKWADVDRLHVTTKARKQPLQQKTARSNVSTLVVLRSKRGGYPKEGT